MRSILRLGCTAAIAAGAVALSGCATQPSSFARINQAAPALYGHRIGYAMNYLGVPDREYPIDTMKVYEWSAAGPVVFIDGMAAQLRCTLRITTEGGNITHVWFQGNNGGCARYANELQPLTTG